MKYIYDICIINVMIKRECYCNSMKNSEIKVGLVIMASGLGKRFGGNKLMADLNGKPLILWGIESSEDIFDKRIVVTRHDTVKQLCESKNIECILHNYPDRNDTVKLGLNMIKDEVDVCFFLTGDQPLISRKTLLNLVDNAKANPQMIIRSCYENIEGNPVGFPKQTFEELLNLPQGKGGKFVVNNHSELVKLVSVENEFELWDVDTKDDLSRFEKMIDNTCCFLFKRL